MAWTNEQLLAIEKEGQNIIVSAGAGSGKTAVLSERVIYKLNHGIHVNELLILTFTRAAADEMKERIRKKIKAFPNLSNELDALNSSYITTFDSFAQSVVKKYHYLLNISKNISITDDSIVSVQKKKILDETFEYYYQIKDERFLKLIKQYSLKNDNYVKDAIEKLSDKADNYIDRSEFFEYLKNDFFNNDNLEQKINIYFEFLNTLKQNVNDLFEESCDYFDETYNQKLSDIVLPILNYDYFELALIDKITLPQVPRGSIDEAKEIKNKLKESIAELLKYCKYKNREELYEELYSTRDTFMTILGIIDEFLQRIEKYKKTNNIYTFQDIQKLSIKLLKENESVRNELKYAFKEIMIDEYQDTNDVQETFINMISNNNVYMVGDIKQSIYRFRGSNPSLFKNKYDNYSNNIDGFKIDLIKNFRSRDEVLDSINRIFDLLMDNYLGGAEYYESHEMIFGNHSYDDEKIKNYNYNATILEYEKDETKEFKDYEIEIFCIAKDIRDKMNNHMQVFDKESSKLRDITYNDFVIILDRSKYFEDYKRIFEYFNIPLTILKDEKINSNDDVKLIKNIIDFIIKINLKNYDSEFKYDFISIARSFLYEYDDEYIFKTIMNNNIFSTSIYNDFSTIDNINSISCDQLINAIIKKTDFYNKIYKIGDYENINVRLNKIYDLANGVTMLGYSIYEFNDYISEILEKDIDIKYTSFTQDSESVKILTIHKSKGLEYPICYFADLNHDFNTMELKDKFVLDKEYGLIIPNENDDQSDTILKILHKNNYIHEEIGEKIRLFYVALTRAREKIIIVLPYSETEKIKKEDNGCLKNGVRSKFKRLSDMLFSIKADLPYYFETVKLNDLKLTKEYLYSNKTKVVYNEIKNDILNVKDISINFNLLDEQKFSKNTIDLINKDDYKNIKLGLEFHKTLEYIDFNNPNFDLINNEFIKNKIIKFFSNDFIKSISDYSVFKEYEFIYTENNIRYNGIIDLLLISDNNVIIIDYKLKNIQDEAYIKQLNGYKKYLIKITNKPVTTYLYSIIEEKLYELNT